MSNLIIGASSGLGREIASEFARNSKNLVLVSRSQKDLEILKRDLEIKYKIKVTVFQLDFSEMNQVSDFISFTYWFVLRSNNLFVKSIGLESK